LRPASVLALLAAALLPACDGGGAGPSKDVGQAVLRVGHFPNVTHAHGLAAHALSRAGAASGNGWFEERLGPGTKIQWFVYNAGPSAMEALLAGSLDFTYVGPNPALNAHARSKGAEVRVLAGATRGGSALVVRADRGIAKPADFRGKKIATPQLGNTQDVACRAWLGEQGIHVTMTGGDAVVLPTQNPDQLPLFAKGDIDAAWTVEPWVSRLEAEAGGKVFLDEKDALTTVLVGSARVLRERPEVARKFVAAHRELTAWLTANPAEAKALVRAEILAETTRSMATDILDRCWARMRFEDGVRREEFDAFTKAARKAGLLTEEPDLSRLVEATK
jgi:NitT/TauT family transport system substrate-binding protein